MTVSSQTLPVMVGTFSKGGLFYAFIKKLLSASFTLNKLSDFSRLFLLIHVHDNSNSTKSLAALKY